MDGARWLAAALRGAGVTHVFFVDAILRRTLIALEEVGITRVLAHSEKAAAYMADGYARVSGMAGICLAQSVGAANLAAGLQDAYLGRAPVLALTGFKPPSHQHRNAYQEIPHAPLFAAVTKFAAQVAGAPDLPRLLRQALRAACAGTPRPAHLDMAGVQGEIVETGEIAEPAGAEPIEARAPAHRPVPPAGEIERAAAALQAAARVVVVAGEGAVVSGAGREVVALAERLGAPIATSLGAHGLVPTRHPLAIGVVGSYSAPPANRIVHAADLVCFVGCDAGDQQTHDWRVPRPGTPVVQVDIDPVELGRSYPRTVGVNGDPRAALTTLLAALKPREPDPGFASWAAGLVAEWRHAMAPLLASDATPIRVERLCAELAAALPPGAVLVADTGYSGIWTGTLVALDGATQRYLRAAGSLGWAFPAALGAKCGKPERRVVCFCGDGAFYYHLPELETARRRGIVVTVVVNNNGGFGQGEATIRRLQGSRPGSPEHINRFEPTDFAAIARAFGVRGIRVEHPAAIGRALREAIGADETVVVDVVTDIGPRAPEPWTPPAEP